jgi:hypothetical protein
MHVLQFSQNNVVILDAIESKSYGNELSEWCKENNKKEWRYRNYISGSGVLYPYEIYINDKSEAMLFKLRWF